ncbi:MAG: LPS export ABC transporter periplasmic protein LptC [Terriglobales bacterium]
MAFDAKRLRKWFAYSAVALLLIVGGFYFYARVRLHYAIRHTAERLQIDIQQSTEGFTLSKSEAGRTLYSIHARRAEQYKDTGRSVLHDVNIVIYGDNSTRFDQIYGSEFAYDPKTGDITAAGEVHIDLQSNTQGAAQPDQATPQELINPIHLKTSGLSFNQKTGIAHTDKLVEFSVPHASGSAVGATYLAKSNAMHLLSQVQFDILDAVATHVTATKADMTQQPRNATLVDVHMQQPASALDASQLVLDLADDNSIKGGTATGDVRFHRGPTVARSPVMTFKTGERGDLQSASMTGGVVLTGERGESGSAGRADLGFDQSGKISKMKVLQNVKLVQEDTGPKASRTELDTNILDIAFNDQGHMHTAVTEGPGVITMTQPTSTTIITAKKFDSTFDDHDRIRTLHGAPEPKIVSRSQNQPDAVTTSTDLLATFNPQGLDTAVQKGDFKYQQGTRAASAVSARYTGSDELTRLEGDPRVTDTGMATTADHIAMNRITGDAFADGNVKGTYVDPKKQPSNNGGLFSGPEPVHVTAQKLVAHQKSGTGRYSGGVRLWQAANVIEAAVVDFARDGHSATAFGNASKKVTTVLVDQDKNGQVVPVNITSDKLTYSGDSRVAHFEGNVISHRADSTLTSDRADVFFAPREQASTASASKLEKIVADGKVVLVEPGRKANGAHLVYTAADAKYVLTGPQNALPSIFDAEHGNVTGDSLTFFSHDDRVLVGSNEQQRAITHTRVKVTQKQ